MSLIVIVLFGFVSIVLHIYFVCSMCILQHMHGDEQTTLWSLLSSPSESWVLNSSLLAWIQACFPLSHVAGLKHVILYWYVVCIFAFLKTSRNLYM